MVNERPVETIKIDDIANNFTELCIKTCFERVEETLIETKAKGRSVLTTALKLLQFKEIEFTIAEAVSNTPNQLNEPISRRIIDLNEVAEHTSEYDCWIVLYDRVYDVTKFLYEHPGGKDVILDYAGRDATIAFRGHSDYALMLLKSYEIGELPVNECLYRVPNLIICSDLPE